MRRCLARELRAVVSAAAFGGGLFMGASPWALSTALAAEEVFNCSGTSVCRSSTTMLPLRGLPRPYANIYKTESAEQAGILVENVAPFSPLYVFARKDIDFSNPTAPAGWYQVGHSVKKAEGWIQAKDLIEWKQALVVSYTHHGVGDAKRNPVLMFKDIAPLSALVQSPTRAEDAKRRYANIAAGTTPTDVVSIEPARFTDIESSFYVLPVLDYQTVDLFEDETRLLRISAAVPQKRSDEKSATTLENAAFKTQAAQTASLAEAKDLGIDIVFVMDLTGSMGKHVTKTKEAILRVVETVGADPAVKNKVHYGFVGYRDDLKVSPSLEFVSRNFTPQLLGGEAFTTLVGQEIKASAVSSDDYAEEVYAGMKTALDETKWSEKALRFIVQVGDASAHEAKHAQSTTGLDAAGLRQMCNDANVSVFSIHLLEERAKADHPIAEAQFTKLASNPGTSTPALFSVETTNLDGYQQIAMQLGGQLTEILKTTQRAQSAQQAAAPAAAPAATLPAAATTAAADALKDLPDATQASAAAPVAVAAAALPTTTAPVATSGDLKDIPAAAPSDIDALAKTTTVSPEMKQMLGASAETNEAKANLQLTNQVAAAALVNYLGGEPVRDITFWAMDRDLVDPTKKSLDVRVLVTKADLNNLLNALSKVVEAMATAQTTQLDFFTSLQSVVSQTAKGEPIDYANAKRLGSTKLLPSWIESLPYRSAILNMDNAMFEAMQPEEHANLEQELKAKLAYYTQTSNTVDAWHALNDNTEEDAKVYPLPLAQLP